MASGLRTPRTRQASAKCTLSHFQREVEKKSSGLISVPVDLGRNLGLGNAEILVEGSYVTDVRHRQYDVSPSAQRFLMMAPTDDPSRDIILVRNWANELERLVPTP